MGREIRKVIPNWNHPKEFNHHRQCDEYTPLFDESYENALKEWIDGRALWVKGEHPDQQKDYCKGSTYEEWNGDAPVSNAYRPHWKPEEMTWFQVYETVSEGTPVTPPFATKEELVDYLVNHGDFWDGKWPRKSAENFVNAGYAPSAIISDKGLQTPKEFMGNS